MAIHSSSPGSVPTMKEPNFIASPLAQAYMRKTPTSAALARRAREVFPSGVTHDVRYMEPHGIYVSHARGSRKWDVDGNEYVDYVGGHGALLLGHAHPEVIAAVQGQLGKGTHYGASHELELEWGELLRQIVPSAQRVRFTNSGTETSMLAIRLARAFTGRKKILRFVRHFHGWNDQVAFNMTSLDGPPPAGVLPEISNNVVMAPPWDWPATQRIIEEHDDIAAVLIEPTGSTWGQVPVAADFVRSLQQAATQRDIILIFDEVISGFRCAPGGAQEALAVTPDLTVLGKIVAGSMPGAALVGREDIMNTLDHRAAADGGFEKVFHQGTYNSMPASCAAAITALKIIRSTDVCQRAIDNGRGLQNTLNDVFRHEDVNWIAYGTYGGFHVFLNPNNIHTTRDEIESGKFDFPSLCASAGSEVLTKLRVGCLLHGVDILPWPGGPVSAVHTDEDRRLTAEAFRQTIRLLKDEGEL